MMREFYKDDSRYRHCGVRSFDSSNQIVLCNGHFLQNCGCTSKNLDFACGVEIICCAVVVSRAFLRFRQLALVHQAQAVDRSTGAVCVGCVVGALATYDHAVCGVQACEYVAQVSTTLSLDWWYEPQAHEQLPPSTKCA